MPDQYIAISKNNIPIRLPEERWAHILEEHGELAEWREFVLLTITNPERIYAGHFEELMAVREVISGKVLVVVYREFEQDGFVITAFLTRRLRSLEKRRQVWP